MLEQKETILITGATGFLGSNILRNLLCESCEIIILKRSSSSIRRIAGIADRVTFYDIDGTNPEEIFQNHKIDTVLHCATNYGRTGFTSTEIIEANLLLPLKLLEAGMKHNLRCFINTDTILDKRLNEYSLSKSQFKQWLVNYASKLSCVNVELEHFYGPDDDASKFVTHVIRSLLAAIDKMDFTKGEQKRYFIYIDDVVDAFKRILKSRHNFTRGFYNFQVGSADEIDIRTFVEKTKLLTNNNSTVLNFGVLPYRENEVMSVDLDLRPLKELGWEPKIALETGLVRTIEFERRGLRA